MIFGDLGEVPLEDLLRLLGRREGSLEIFHLEGHPSLEVYFKGGRVVSGFIGGRPTPLPELRAALLYLVKVRKGQFQFRSQASPLPSPYPLNLPLGELLPSQEEGLVDPHLRLRLKAPGARPEDYHLRAFLKRAEGLLLEGASPWEVSQALGLPLERAQYYLHRLLGLGLLTRVSPTTPAKGREGEKPDVAKLIQTLKARFFGGKP